MKNTKQEAPKHTQGKWRTFQAADGNIYITSDTNDVAVIQTATKESIANSKLISQSPAMLERLESVDKRLLAFYREAELNEQDKEIIFDIHLGLVMEINAAKGGSEK